MFVQVGLSLATLIIAAGRAINLAELLSAERKLKKFGASFPHFIFERARLYETPLDKDVVEGRFPGDSAEELRLAEMRAQKMLSLVTPENIIWHQRKLQRSSA